jgi:hypothetical protein
MGFNSALKELKPLSCQRGKYIELLKMRANGRWELIWRLMKAGFSNEDSLHCQLTMHHKCHTINSNKKYCNFWIEATTFPEMSFRTEAILI